MDLNLGDALDSRSWILGFSVLNSRFLGFSVSFLPSKFLVFTFRIVKRLAWFWCHTSLQGLVVGSTCDNFPLSDAVSNFERSCFMKWQIFSGYFRIAGIPGVRPVKLVPRLSFWHQYMLFTLSCRYRYHPVQLQYSTPTPNFNYVRYREQKGFGSY